MVGGVLYTADYYGCTPMDSQDLGHLFIEALKKAGAHVVFGTDIFHRFPNGATSGTTILKESHAAIHTWPEENFVTFELFTCGESVNALTAINFLAEHLKCSDYTTNRHSRFSKNATV